MLLSVVAIAVAVASGKLLRLAMDGVDERKQGSEKHPSDKRRRVATMGWWSLEFGGKSRLRQMQLGGPSEFCDDGPCQRHVFCNIMRLYISIANATDYAPFGYTHTIGGRLTRKKKKTTKICSQRTTAHGCSNVSCSCRNNRQDAL